MRGLRGTDGQDAVSPAEAARAVGGQDGVPGRIRWAAIGLLATALLDTTLCGGTCDGHWCRAQSPEGAASRP